MNRFGLLAAIMAATIISLGNLAGAEETKVAQPATTAPTLQFAGWIANESGLVPTQDINGVPHAVMLLSNAEGEMTPAFVPYTGKAEKYTLAAAESPQGQQLGNEWEVAPITVGHHARTEVCAAPAECAPGAPPRGRRPPTNMARQGAYWCSFHCTWEVPHAPVAVADCRQNTGYPVAVAASPRVYRGRSYSGGGAIGYTAGGTPFLGSTANPVGDLLYTVRGAEEIGNSGLRFLSFFEAVRRFKDGDGRVRIRNSPRGGTGFDFFSNRR